MALINKYEKQSVFDLLLENSGAISGLFEFLKSNHLSELEIPSGEYLLEEVLKKDVVDFFEGINAYNAISTGTITSFADGFMLVEVRNSLGDLIATKNISLTDYYVDVEDSDITINGESVGSVPSTASKDLTVKLNGSLAGSWNDMTQEWEVVSAIPSDGWQRPSDWLPIADTAPGTEKIQLLLAVYETSVNNIAFICTNNYHVSVSNGISTSVASGVKFQALIDWNTVDPSTLTSGGYRQVLVTITPQSGNQLHVFNCAVSYTGFTNKATNVLDAVFDYVGLKGADFGVDIQPFNMLQRVFIRTGSAVPYLYRCMALKSFIAANGGTQTQYNQTFSFTGIEKTPPLDFSNATVMYGTFRDSLIKEFIAVTTTADLTDIMFYNTPVRVVEMDGNAVTSCTSMFVNCPDLHRLIFRGLKISLTISNTNINTEQAQLDFFNSIANLTGFASKTITMVGLIQYPATVHVLATSKNWNIIY